MFKVRFHLGAGKNYKHWRIETPEKQVTFYNPDSFNFKLIDCKLHNQKGTAKKIHDGGTKNVCAWIMCKEVIITDSIEEGLVLSYNPRIEPNWRCEEKNCDDMEFKEIHIINKNLYAKH